MDQPYSEGITISNHIINNFYSGEINTCRFFIVLAVLLGTIIALNR